MIQIPAHEIQLPSGRIVFMLSLVLTKINPSHKPLKAYTTMPPLMPVTRKAELHHPWVNGQEQISMW